MMMMKKCAQNKISQKLHIDLGSRARTRAHAHTRKEERNDLVWTVAHDAAVQKE